MKKHMKSLLLLVPVASIQIAFGETPSVVSVVESRMGDPVPSNLISAMNAGNLEAFNAILEESDFDINEIIVIGDDYRRRAAASPTGNPLDAPVLPASFFAPKGERINLSTMRWTLDYQPNRIGGDHYMNEFLPALCPDKPARVKKLLGYHYVSPALGAERTFGHTTFSTLYGTLLMVAARTGNAFMVRELLKRGADPSIIIKTGGVEMKMGIRDCERPYMCALIEAATEGMFYKAFPSATEILQDGHKKTSRNIAECLELLVAAGASLPPPDGMGRNALWDALACQNETLLNLALKSGVDINSRDNKGKTVLDYCARAAGDTSRTRGERVSYERFAAFLRKAGGTCAEESEEENEDAKSQGAAGQTYPQGMQNNGPYGGTGSYGMSGQQSGVLPPAFNRRRPKVGIAALPPHERAALKVRLEQRLRALETEFIKAESNGHRSAFLGISEVTSSMITDNVMRQIADVKRQLLELSQCED